MFTDVCKDASQEIHLLLKAKGILLLKCMRIRNLPKTHVPKPELQDSTLGEINMSSGNVIFWESP